jgi:hypothetical protein
MPEMLPLRETDPREVGKYRLLGRLGEGGQGVVFLAVGPDGSQVALKLLPPTTNPQVRNRFLKEVAAAQRVARFCTAQVLDAGFFERRPYIVSEYVSGPSLVEVVEQFGPHTDAALERIAVATLTALGAVHAVGMVHRDVKPGNVLLGPDGPVVIDFGLAVVPGMTTTGMSGQAIGTPAYMAPEQLAGERGTAAADMWSWAVMMVYAGTGELPFKGESLTATAYAIFHSEPDVGRLPEPLASLVHRCLNKDPAGRPSARGALGEFVAAGARLVGPMPPRSAADDGELISGGLTPRPRRRRHGNDRASSRRRTTALLTVILLAAGAGGLAFALYPRGTLAQRNAGLERPTGGHAQTSPVAIESTVRTEAINWILHQVSPDEIVVCDAQVCNDLAKAGFNFSNLIPLGLESNDPLGGALVVATATVRSQFGARLSVYAPALIASFGSGNARIDIRWDYPDGGAAYKSALPAMASQRITFDAPLLTNSQLTFSAAARKQVLGGQIDPYLPPLLVLMAAQHPLYIADFASESPGGDTSSLMRWVDLATTAQAAQVAHLTRTAYIDWMLAYLGQQRAEYVPDWWHQVTLHPGDTVLRIGFGAPSQLSPDTS